MTLAIILFMQLHPPSHSPWHTAPPPVLTSAQKSWLLRPGALTAGLRQQGEVQLEVLREYAGGVLPAEAWMLARGPRSPIWVREIVMSIDGTYSVFARSFTPLAASHGLWQGMRRLRTRPLADMLYHDAQIVRSNFFVCRMSQQNPLYQSARQFLSHRCPPAHAMLARCSVFWRRGEPLLVAECFLPDFWTLASRAVKARETLCPTDYAPA